MAQDPYKYFRVEARELLDGLTQGVLELEKGKAGNDCVNSLLRLAHTLKGAARVVKQPAMAELAHGIEDLLAPYREDAGPIPRESAREMLQLLDQIAGGLPALGLPPPSAQAPARPVAEEPIETVRVEVEEVEALLGRLSEAGAELAGIEKEASGVKQAKQLASLMVQQLQMRGEERNGSVAGRVRTLAGQLLESLQIADRRLGESVERLGREVSQAGELANRMRLLPCSAIFPSLARVARDAAAMLGKQVQFEAAGGDLRLDAQVLTILRDALVQLVRNAVAHGIESEEPRASSGKPRRGRVELKIERRGNRVAFLCRDDGAGLDIAAIRRTAVKKGVISAARAASLELPGAIDLLLRGGLSTTGQVDAISGRGIGLDIVRAAVTRLKGEIAVDTDPGRGTTFEMCVPASLTSLAALTVESGGVRALLPLDCVRQTLRLDGQAIARCGTHESIAFEGKPIPFLRLSAALGGLEPGAPIRVESRNPLLVTEPRPSGSAPEDGVPGKRASGLEPASSPGQLCAMVIVASGKDLAAIGVDRLMGTGTVLVRALPALAPAARPVNGATVDSQGNPQLFLDPAGLVQAAIQGDRRSRPAGAPGAPILIIDDSLTTRMVEQGILESAGYLVELATSAEEALEKAQARPYSLFLVDVEMPGIDGFEFVSRTRADPVLREVPAILVTSRASPEDRRRGKESGARAYIVKGEFDQGHFLETVRQLVRRSHE